VLQCSAPHQQLQKPNCQCLGGHCLATLAILSYLQPKKTMFLVTVQCRYRKYYSCRRPSVSSSSACPMHIPSGEVHVTCTQVPKGRTQPLLRAQPLYAIHTHTMWCNTRLRYLKKATGWQGTHLGPNRTARALHTRWWWLQAPSPTLSRMHTVYHT
jgi:hypothetical protein